MHAYLTHTHALLLQMDVNLLHRADVLWNRLVPSLEQTDACELLAAPPEKDGDPIVETGTGRVRGVRRVDEATGGSAILRNGGGGQVGLQR